MTKILFRPGTAFVCVLGFKVVSTICPLALIIKTSRKVGYDAVYAVGFKAAGSFGRVYGIGRKFKTSADHGFNEAAPEPAVVKRYVFGAKHLGAAGDNNAGPFMDDDQWLLWEGGMNGF